MRIQEVIWDKQKDGSVDESQCLHADWARLGAFLCRLAGLPWGVPVDGRSSERPQILDPPSAGFFLIGRFAAFTEHPPETLCPSYLGGSPP